jgi:hypothetical protein
MIGFVKKVRHETRDYLRGSRISTSTGVLDAGRHKGRAAYQYFLTPWEDADPDIPMLKGTKAEYAKLQ